MQDLSVLNRAKTIALIQALRQRPFAVAMDTEQTCWEGSLERQWGGPREAREVIQIGAVRLDTRDFSEISTFEVIATPATKTTLSDFCVELTGVTQERLDREGLPFSDAYSAFERYIDGAPVIVYRADETVMRENLAFNNDPRDPGSYLLLRQALEECGVDMSGINSGKIARTLGSSTATREHDALADARSMGEGLSILARLVDQWAMDAIELSQPGGRAPAI